MMHPLGDLGQGFNDEQNIVVSEIRAINRAAGYPEVNECSPPFLAGGIV